MANLRVNRVEICGRLCADPELKVTKGGVPCTTVAVAVGRNYLNREGVRETDFFHVDIYGQAAEYVCRHMKCGESIWIEGSLRVRGYIDPRHGDRRVVTEIVVREVQSVDPKKKENDGSFDEDEFFDAAVRRSYSEDMKGEEDEA